MSENSTSRSTDSRAMLSRSTDQPNVDRRIRKTRHALGGALMDLIREKDFDSITVQDVLDRAGVSRSTFYVHYKDKNDLFISDVDGFFEALATMLSRKGDPSERVAPVREFFAHVREQRQLLESLSPDGRLQDVFELGRGHFARGIAQRLSELPRGRGISPERRKLAGQAYAGALISLLVAWLHRGTPESPEEMDDLYHGMVWSGVHTSGPE